MSLVLDGSLVAYTVSPNICGRHVSLSLIRVCDHYRFYFELIGILNIISNFILYAELKVGYVTCRHAGAPNELYLEIAAPLPD